ncbi:hypothetical protein TRIATDRAFT_273685 [Trichoderma atroviride IMI 206040]|uniref:Uncharacterized protein n=1 Tax=Hypocrea atroviridis (strain ATCC 20476 / IMI 206040) TaxID=452589 RepID=G9NU94_HYPAI|nr:uncharacterized protein TRIATDRAFT_273685 [Trichoderma atroviride IMI 206040]EHK45627.1 hypothetical protein TRIATDRAFT_273685 [Trichoderma atroviride IMI 206040]
MAVVVPSWDSCCSGKPPTTTSNDDSQCARLYHNDNINRFLADETQRCPVGLGPEQTQSEAETVGKARVFENLQAFDVQFDCDKFPRAKGVLKVGIKRVHEVPLSDHNGQRGIQPVTIGLIAMGGAFYSAQN